jgi:hypothetical protein
MRHRLSQESGFEAVVQPMLVKLAKLGRDVAQFDEKSTPGAVSLSDGISRERERVVAEVENGLEEAWKELAAIEGSSASMEAELLWHSIEEEWRLKVGEWWGGESDASEEECDVEELLQYRV